VPEGTIADICCKIGRLVIEAKNLSTVLKVMLMGSVTPPKDIAAVIAVIAAK
jgi:hypothetical protein